MIAFCLLLILLLLAVLAVAGLMLWIAGRRVAEHLKNDPAAAAMLAQHLFVPLLKKQPKENPPAEPAEESAPENAEPPPPDSAQQAEPDSAQAAPELPANGDTQLPGRGRRRGLMM